jgi:Tol biopolymer transport system component
MVRRTVLEAAADEIVMIGSQGTISPVAIHGTLAYISGGNGVAMRISSINRDPITTSGDLDGRVFSLSPDGRRLLYSRSIGATPPQTGTLPAFNSLWVISYRPAYGSDASDSTRPRPLRVENVLWANWSPDGTRIAYSTAEPIAQPPGWEANNDLWLGDWDARGRFRSEQLLEPSSGGVYGWWGADYAWSPDGRYVAYGQADGVGTIEVSTTRRLPLAEFSVFHTYADWVWTPAPTWSPDSSFIAAAVHGPPIGPEAVEDSQVFDLWAWGTDGGLSAPLAGRTGMWAAPAWSPAYRVSDEDASQIAFLRSTNPLESATSRYRLWLMDRDGSDARLLFPPAGEVGLRPQRVAWSPEADQIALIYHGDLYLIATANGSARPLTRDGVNSNPVWAPWGTPHQGTVPVPHPPNILLE